MELKYTRVGDVELPELPSGWPLAVDSEGSGLSVDGEPFATSKRPPAPPARISVVSVSFPRPIWDAHSEQWIQGELLDYAWAFDQGPVVGKPGRSVADPDTEELTFYFVELTTDEQQKVLAKFGEYYGLDRPLTVEEACPNLPPAEYAALVGWLDRRDYMEMHNSVHDMHQFRVGLRADAGGFGGEEGFAAWDPDSEPGQWRLGQPQRLHMMEPTSEKLVGSGPRRHIRCTMVVQKQLIDPLEMSALKKTAKRLWGEEEGEELAKLEEELSLLKVIGPRLHKRYDLLPFCGAMKIYAADDTNKTRRVAAYQDQAAEEGATLPGFWDLYHTEMDTRTTLYRMERRGMAYNSARSVAEGRRLLAEMKEVRKLLPYEPTKTNEVKRFYFGPVCGRTENEGSNFEFHSKDCEECGGKNGIGITPKYRTPTGQPQLTESVLDEFTEEGHPFCGELARYRKLRNSVSRWYFGWGLRVGADGRLRTSFKQCKSDFDRPGQAEGGTKSGRLAVGRVQFQAIPHGHLIPEGAEPVRGYIGDEEGYEHYEHDLATGEMRVVTVIANSTKLWDAIDAGADLHAMNAEAFFKEKGTPAHPKFKQFRNAAKRGTFGLLYGGGPMGLKEQIEAAAGEKISLKDVKEAIESFFQTYPEFKTLTQQAEYKVTRWMGGPGYLKMLDGWRRWYALNEKTNSAVNQVIQGNLARAMLKWMLAVERELPGVLLLQIHDSLVTRHRSDEEGRAQARRVSEIGEREFQRYFGVRDRVMTWGIEPDLWSADK